MDEDLLPRDTSAKDKILMEISDRIDDKQRIFVINPGAKFEEKCWPAQRFGKVAAWLSEKYQTSVIITGTASEKTIAEEVVRVSEGTAINMAGRTTIQELIELLRMAAGCVTNDTGTMHLAAILGLPTVGVFSTDYSPPGPVTWFPLGNKSIAVFSLLDYTDGDKFSNVLENIGVDDVVRAIEEVVHQVN